MVISWSLIQLTAYYMIAIISFSFRSTEDKSLQHPAYAFHNLRPFFRFSSAQPRAWFHYTGNHDTDRQAILRWHNKTVNRSSCSLPEATSDKFSHLSPQLTRWPWAGITRFQVIQEKCEFCCFYITVFIWSSEWDHLHHHALKLYFLSCNLIIIFLDFTFKCWIFNTPFY